ncbi:MAG: hypothetical protein ABW133_22475 [Polyangiaceae bacterium]
MKERRTKVVKGAALLLLVLVGTCAVVRSKKGPPLPTPPPIVAAEPAPTTERAAPRSEISPRAALNAMPPVIDEITLEKDEVCEGNVATADPSLALKTPRMFTTNELVSSNAGVTEPPGKRAMGAPDATS